MTRPLITIDIDDVLADTTEAIRLAVNQHTGHDITQEQYKITGEYWGYYESVWKEAGIDHLITFEDLRPTISESTAHIQEISESRAVLERFRGTFRYALVTSRDEQWRESTEQWITERYGDLFEGLYFTGDRHHESYRSKGELCASLGAVLHIDDNVGHCQSVIEQGILAILYGEYGWQFDIPEGPTRCRTWREVGVYLDGITV